MKIKLEAKNDMERRILDYLEENASDILIDKINNGVPIEKDGIALINKKTLTGFIAYATEEAKKLAEKGARGMFVDDPTVYGWAIHYFEEDSIEGTLYNTDGTEYKPSKKPVTTKTTTTQASAPKTKKKSNEGQFSLFDMMLERGENIDNPPADDEEDELPSEEEMQEILQELHEQEQEEIQKKKGSPIYQRYMQLQETYTDCIIIYRLGDFYEVFGENAKVLARELDLTLTGRDCGLDERLPMIGFPYHAADNYFRKIIEKGFKIAIAEDMDNVRLEQPSADEVVDDDLTVKEMQEFDGDVDDGKHWIDKNTYVDDAGEIHDVSQDDLAEEFELAKAFEKNSLFALDEIFGNLIILR